MSGGAGGRPSCLPFKRPPIFSQGEISGGMGKREEGGEIERSTGEESWLSLQEVTHYYFFICVFFLVHVYFLNTLI